MEFPQALHPKRDYQNTHLFPNATWQLHGLALTIAWLPRQVEYSQALHSEVDDQDTSPQMLLWMCLNHCATANAGGVVSGIAS